jgi:hypothetical protein
MYGTGGRKKLGLVDADRSRGLTEGCGLWQCWESVIFWYWSGSSVPYLWLTDPDANPGGLKPYGSYGIRIRMGIRNTCTFTSKVIIKKLQKNRNQRFSYYFCLVTEGPGAGSLLVSYGSGCGSGRPKNIRILRIRIRMRILIPNTGLWRWTCEGLWIHSHLFRIPDTILQIYPSQDLVPNLTTKTRPNRKYFKKCTPSPLLHSRCNSFM